MSRGLPSVAILALLPAMAGCEAMQSGAPVVTPAMVLAAGESGGSAESLTRGRRLLAQRCVNCHGLEPVAKYSAVRWKAIVLDMAERSGLSAAETHEITAYLVAARKSLP